jgi:hypothetical protein
VPVRRLTVDGRPLIDLGVDCDTCYLTMDVLGSTSRSVLDDVRDRLVRGLDELDPAVLDAVGSALPAGDYTALLLEVRPSGPSVVFAGEPGTEEQEVGSPVRGYPVGAPFPAPWRLHDPAYEYYYARGLASAPPRTTPVVVREVLVPLVDSATLDPEVVRAHAARLAGGTRSVAVAWSVLERVDDDEIAWVHYLLDGHHKVHAAAIGAGPVGLLSLLSCTAGTVPEERARQLLRSLTAPVPPAG